MHGFVLEAFIRVAQRADVLLPITRATRRCAATAMCRALRRKGLRKMSEQTPRKVFCRSMSLFNILLGKGFVHHQTAEQVIMEILRKEITEFMASKDRLVLLSFKRAA